MSISNQKIFSLHGKKAYAVVTWRRKKLHSIIHIMYLYKSVVF